MAALRAGRSAELHAALWRWHRAMHAGERAARRLREAREASLEMQLLRCKGLALARLPRALAHASLPLSAGLDRWRAAATAATLAGESRHE